MSVSTMQAWRDLLRALTDVGGSSCADCAEGRTHRCYPREIREAVAAFKKRQRLEEDEVIRTAVAVLVLDDLCDRQGVGDQLDAVRADDPEIWNEIRDEVGRRALRVVEREVLGGSA